MLSRKLAVTLSVLLAFALSPLSAQEAAPGEQAQPARDVRLVVDISGSMKLNDPDNLRRPAVRLIARLLPEDTHAGLWTFGRMVNMLVPHDAMSPELRATLIKRSDDINSIAQRTNLGGAIEEASDPWYAPDRDLSGTHLILLSDGKVDISPSAATNDQERDRILNELVPRLAEAGLTIHTIALSSEADLDLLGAVADMTGGVARVAESADELSRIFADTLGQAVPANEVPLENNRFQVDGGVEEFTALIFSATPPDERQLELINPAGGRFGFGQTPENIRWAREPGYDLITVSGPMPGEWQVEGTLGEGSRVTVVSDLRLQVAPIPARIELGQEVGVEAWFTEEGQRINDPDFLGVITVSLSMTTDDGRRGTRVLSGETPPEDGVYRDTIARLPEPGQYLLELEADGETFSRKYRQTLTLVAPEDQPAAGVPVEVPVSSDEEDPAPTAPEEAAAPQSGPVDLSLVEEPESAPEAAATPEPEAATEGPENTTPEPAASPSPTGPLAAWWPWLAGGVTAVIAALGLVFWWWRRRKSGGQDGDADTSAAESPGPEPEPEPEREPPVARKEEPTEFDDLTDGLEPAPEDSVDPLESLGSMEREDEAGSGESLPDEEPESEISGAAGEPTLEVDEADIPELDETAEAPEESRNDDEVPEASRDEDPGLEDFDDSLLDEEDSGDDEFGLEDFDLSDIDDLPDLETDEDDRQASRNERDGEDKKP